MRKSKSGQGQKLTMFYPKLIRGTELSIGTQADWNWNLIPLGNIVQSRGKEDKCIIINTEMGLL